MPKAARQTEKQELRQDKQSQHITNMQSASAGTAKAARANTMHNQETSKSAQAMAMHGHAGILGGLTMIQHWA